MTSVLRRQSRSEAPARNPYRHHHIPIHTNSEKCMHRRVMLYGSILLLALVGPVRSASVPLLVSHQGRLLDSEDAPVSGVHSLTFGLYEAPAGGAAL